MADVAQQRLRLFLVERTAQTSLLLLDAVDDQVAQLGDDVLALGLGQQGRDGGQVTIDADRSWSWSPSEWG
jgi:hypothetical protein